MYLENIIWIENGYVGLGGQLQLRMRPRYPFILKRHQSTVPLPRSASEDLVTLRAALRGTVPEHQALLLLHTETHPKKWPTDVNKVSPLLREIQAHVKEFNGKVLMCYPGAPGYC